MRKAGLLRAGQELNDSRDLGFDLIRAYLGIALFVRGAFFIMQPQALLDLIATSGGWFWPAALAHYVAAAHLVGGALLAFGLYTRLAAAVQLPVLAGAVFVTHWGEGLMSRGQSLELAGLVFFMLVVYTVFGAGPLSVDAHFGKRPDVSGDTTQAVTNEGYDDYAQHGAT